MTDEHKNEIGGVRPSPLPFDPSELTAVRVRPAVFARMCQVSKQCVSQWIKEGKITRGTDGLIDPTQAARQVFERTDPGRLRARVFKNAMSTQDQLKQRVRTLEQQIKDLKYRQEMSTHNDELAFLLDQFCNRIEEKFGVLVAALEQGELQSALDMLLSPIFYPDNDVEDLDLGATLADGQSDGTAEKVNSARSF